LITSFLTVLAFISTSVLAWRKEKRERLGFELEYQKKELEIEKLRRELENKG